MSLDKRTLYKLKSQEGASITFALLIFLVCAVLSSVIITAATTASGRMANIAHADRNYYAVKSAAELLKDTIDGTTVTVERIVETETGSASSDITIFTISKGSQIDEDTIIKDSSLPALIKQSFAAHAVYSLGYDLEVVSKASETPTLDRDLSMILKDNNNFKNKVLVHEIISPPTSSDDSSIEFVLKNAKDNTDGIDKLSYTMKVYFDIDIEKNETVITYKDDDKQKTSTITYFTFYYKDIE